MLKLPRPTSLFAWTLPLLLAGCGDTADKRQSDSKGSGKPQAETKALAEAKPKADTKKAPEAKSAAEAEKEKAEAEAEIKESLAKLSPEDRKLAEAQRFCAVNEDDRLGSMGPPVKVMVQGKPVFLCCGSCRRQAMAEPEKTLAKAEELKKKGAAPAK